MTHSLDLGTISHSKKKKKKSHSQVNKFNIATFYKISYPENILWSNIPSIFLRLWTGTYLHISLAINWGKWPLSNFLSPTGQHWSINLWLNFTCLALSLQKGTLTTPSEGVIPTKKCYAAATETRRKYC